MLRYLIGNLIFFVVLRNSYSCYCNPQNFLINTKGETGFDERRKLVVEESSGGEYQSASKIGESGVNYVENTIFENTPSVDLVPVRKRHTVTTASTPSTTEAIVSTLLMQFTTFEYDTAETDETIDTKISQTEEIIDKTTGAGVTGETINTTIKTTDLSEIKTTTTDTAISETSVVTETSLILNNTGNTESTEDLEAKDANLIVTQPSYTGLNIGTDVTTYCNKYKKSNTLNINKMADVWKITYYTMPHQLRCFKLHLKLLTREDQKYYATIYGNFNNKIHWDKCVLEILSKNFNNITSQRKHFLQDDGLDTGVLKNIIIEENLSANSASLFLVEEAPNQWLVVKNLLLLRDCNTGDIVIFARVPMVPKIIDLKEALTSFGEPNVLSGTRTCL